MKYNINNNLGLPKYITTLQEVGHFNHMKPRSSCALVIQWQTFRVDTHPYCTPQPICSRNKKTYLNCFVTIKQSNNQKQFGCG